MEIIKNTINILCSSLDIDNKQRFYFLSKYLDKNAISKDDLKNHFDIAFFTNERKKLVQFIKENDELIENIDLYAKDELINYIKEWLWDFLCPEKVITIEQIEELNEGVINVLKNYRENEGWMFSYDLYNELKKQAEFKNLEYYNLWKIHFQKLNRV